MLPQQATLEEQVSAIDNILKNKKNFFDPLKLSPSIPICLKINGAPYSIVDFAKWNQGYKVQLVCGNKMSWN